MSRSFLMFLGFLLSALSIGLPIAAGAASKAPVQTALALNWKPEPQFGGFYEAVFGGHDSKNGLKIDVKPGGAGTPVVQMVAAGQMDFGIVSADEVVISRSRGSDVVALFATYQTNPQGIMVHEKAGFKTLKDVFDSPGTTLALQRGLPYAMYLLNKFGAPKAKIVPYTGGISSFLNDPKFAQQCFVTSEPLEARKKGMKPKTFLVADEGYNPYTTVLITRESVLKAKPDLVKNMIAAVRAGWSDYLKNPERANREMRKLNPSMDEQTFKESSEAQKPLIQTAETSQIGLGSMTETRWKELTDQLHQMKVISRKPDAKTLFTTF